MFEGLRDKAGFLDETICRLGEAIAEKESIEEAPQEFFRSGPDSFYALGRICCDATTDGARLNAHSILLQGNQASLLFGKGSQVNDDGCPERIFPSSHPPVPQTLSVVKTSDEPTC